MKILVWDTRPCSKSRLTFSSSCMKSLQRIVRIFGSFSPWSQVSRPTSCLTTAFTKTLLHLYVLLSSACMVESPGQKKLRLTKARLERELRERTVHRLSQLRIQSEGRAAATDIEEKGTQCSDSSPWLFVCLFCFLLVVANLLFIQWLWFYGRLKLN